MEKTQGQPNPDSLKHAARDASALVRRAFAWSVEDLRAVLGAAARVADLKTLVQLTTALEAATRRNRGPAEKPLVLRDDDVDESLRKIFLTKVKGPITKVSPQQSENPRETLC